MMDFDNLNNDPNLPDNSDFDNSYNNDFDIVTEYEDIMSDVEMEEIIPDFDTNIDFYEVVETWDDEYQEDDVTGRLSRKGKRNYNSLKESKNEYKKEFAEEMTMLNDLLEEANKFSKKLDKKYDAIEGSKTKGMSKYTSDLIQSILTAKSTKLQIVKEMTSLKKTIIDLQIKEGKRLGAEDGDESITSSANSYFREIMKVGRKDFIDTLEDSRPSVSTSDYNLEEIEYANKMSEQNDELNERIAKRLEENGTNRSEEGSKYILYENMNVELKIKFNVMNNDWKVVAINDQGQEIMDYPTPTKADLGKVKFSSDNKFATDKYGRSYKVIEIYS